jgi:site-specific DNA-methyltransferase (adenine-specific)
MTSPYYADEYVTLYHGDCRIITEWLAADVLICDPPYGIEYNSGRPSTLARSISGDDDTALRDWILEQWGDRPAIVFGTWRISRPAGTRARLIWDTKGALGMGDLSLPWKPSDQEIYVLGKGFAGRRTSNVISCAPVQSMAKNGRLHPHEKPVALLAADDLLGKCPAGDVADPTAGSGSTLVAAKLRGRRAIGVELEESDCENAARRLSQGTLGDIAPMPELVHMPEPDMLDLFGGAA